MQLEMPSSDGPAPIPPLPPWALALTSTPSPVLGNTTGWSESLGVSKPFVVAYASVCFALPRYLRHHGVSHPETQVVAWLAGTAMLLALAGNLYPVPEGPYGKLPLIYLGYLTAGLLWFALRLRVQG